MTFPRIAATPLVFALVLGAAAQGGLAQDRFAGSWRISGAVDAAGAAVSPASLIGSRIVFAAGSVAGPTPFGCAGAVFETLLVSPPGLFRGAYGEGEAGAAAAQLGIPAEAETLRVDCDTGSFDYHAAGPRLMTMLDGVVYVLQRE